MRHLCAIPAALAALVASLAFAAPAGAVTYSNPSRIAIADNTIANPYPAPIAVSAMNGEITDLTVTLNGLSHTFLDDVGVLLEAPTGETLLLMDGIGPKVNPSPGAGVSNIDLTFDDAAPTQLDDTIVPATGSYRPANYYPATGTVLDSFPAPGPGNTYGNPGPAAAGTATMLGATGAFTGIEANGVWKLFIRDFSGLDQGEVARGWSLDVDTVGGGGDITPPETTIVSGPSGTIAAAGATFTFSSNEPGTFECDLDGQGFEPCATPHELAGLADGPHTLEVRAVDSAGLIDPTPDSRGFTVDIPEPPPPSDPPASPPPAGADTKAPTATIAKIAVKKKKRSAKVTFSGSDDVTAPAGLRFTCSLDGKAAAPCTSPATFKKLRPGRHRVEVKATDGAGNVSAPAVKTFRVKKVKRAKKTSRR